MLEFLFLEVLVAVFTLFQSHFRFVCVLGLCVTASLSFVAFFMRMRGCLFLIVFHCVKINISEQKMQPFSLSLCYFIPECVRVCMCICVYEGNHMDLFLGYIMNNNI